MMDQKFVVGNDNVTIFYDGETISHETVCAVLNIFMDTYKELEPFDRHIRDEDPEGIINMSKLAGYLWKNIANPLSKISKGSRKTRGKHHLTES